MRYYPCQITLLAVLVVVSGPCPVSASTESRALTREAYRLAYGLKFAESVGVLDAARRADPGDPAPARAIAAVTWMEILFGQGAATFAAFSGEAPSESVPRPSVPAHLADRFLTHVEEATRLAQRQMALRPQDADAQYQLGATSGLLSLYRGTVEGRTLAAFSEARRAVGILEGIRERDPRHRESALIPGIYRYAVSTLPWPKRLLAAASGMAGDRDGGIRLLETAAADVADTSTDATLVLMVVYNREGRRADAFNHLKRLQVRHPGNRLLHLNAAATALAAAKPAVAVDEVARGLAVSPTVGVPHVLGERALWIYTRGVARSALGDLGAEGDLRQALGAGPRDWVRAHTHAELARLAVHAGNLERARVEGDLAVHYGQRAGDRPIVAAVKRLLSKVKS